jgi:hypothetical protein
LTATTETVTDVAVALVKEAVPVVLLPEMVAPPVIPQT